MMRLTLFFDVRRAKARFPSGRQTHPATFTPAGSNRSSRGGNETAEASGVEGHFGDSASMRAATCSERRAGSEKGDVEADPDVEAGKAVIAGEESEMSTQRFHRGIGGGTHAQGDRRNTGNPDWWLGRASQPDAREGQAGLLGVAEGSVLYR